MKNTRLFSTKQDLEQAAKSTIVSYDLTPDKTTGLKRCAVVRSFSFVPETSEMHIGLMVFFLDSKGNPLNSHATGSNVNFHPSEKVIKIQNSIFVDPQTNEVIPANLVKPEPEDQPNGLGDLNNESPKAKKSKTKKAMLVHGKDYLGAAEAFASQIMNKNADIPGIITWGLKNLGQNL
jgi:hypothetical protein